MTDIKLDRTRFRIAHIHGRISISFEPDDGSYAAHENGCDRRHVFRRMIVDWDPSVADAVAQLDALPVPTSSLDPTIDHYLDIVEQSFGPFMLLTMTNDEELLRQTMQSDREAIQARLDRKAA